MFPGACRNVGDAPHLYIAVETVDEREPGDIPIVLNENMEL